MTRDPAALRYLASHEWVEAPDSANAGVVAIGISSFAVEQLTDLVYLALPAVGREVKRGDEVGEVESVKAFEATLARLDKSKPVNVLFRRGDWAQYVLIRPAK